MQSNIQVDNMKTQPISPNAFAWMVVQHINYNYERIDTEEESNETRTNTTTANTDTTTS